MSNSIKPSTPPSPEGETPSTEELLRAIGVLVRALEGKSGNPRGGNPRGGNPKGAEPRLSRAEHKAASRAGQELDETRRAGEVPLAIPPPPLDSDDLYPWLRRLHSTVLDLALARRDLRHQVAALVEVVEARAQQADAELPPFGPTARPSSRHPENDSAGRFGAPLRSWLKRGVHDSAHTALRHLRTLRRRLLPPARWVPQIEDASPRQVTFDWLYRSSSKVDPGRDMRADQRAQASLGGRTMASGFPTWAEAGWLLDTETRLLQGSTSAATGDDPKTEIPFEGAETLRRTSSADLCLDLGETPPHAVADGLILLALSTLEMEDLRFLHVRAVDRDGDRRRPDLDLLLCRWSWWHPETGLDRDRLHRAKANRILGKVVDLDRTPRHGAGAVRTSLLRNRGGQKVDGRAGVGPQGSASGSAEECAEIPLRQAPWDDFPRRELAPARPGARSSGLVALGPYRLRGDSRPQPFYLPRFIGRAEPRHGPPTTAIVVTCPISLGLERLLTALLVDTQPSSAPPFLPAENDTFERSEAGQERRYAILLVPPEGPRPPHPLLGLQGLTPWLLPIAPFAGGIPLGALTAHALQSLSTDRILHFGPGHGFFDDPTLRRYLDLPGAPRVADLPLRDLLPSHAPPARPDGIQQLDWRAIPMLPGGSHGPLPSRSVARLQMGLEPADDETGEPETDRRFFVVCICDLVADSAPETFVDLARAFRSRPEFLFILVGKGPLDGAVDARARHHGLRQFRRLSAVDDRLAVAAADVVCSLGRPTPLPGPVALAARAGRPIVARAASDSDSCSGWAGLNIRSIPSDDPRSLLEAMVEVIRELASRVTESEETPRSEPDSETADDSRPLLPTEGWRDELFGKRW